ncbi:MAG: hypothetical protein AAGI23_05355 [Bacteroidota bacterium]
MLNIKETADNLRAKVKEVNDDFFKVSNEIVEETIAAGEQWQTTFAKALSTGVEATDTTQKLALKAVAGMREQYMEGSQRLMKLVGIDTKQITRNIKETADEARATVTKATATAKKKATKVIEQTATDAKQAVAKSKASAKTKAKATKDITKATKAAKKEVADVAKATTKAAAKAAKAMKPTVERDNLKLLNGVGPKMESVLNKYGIETFADLAKADAKNLATLIETEDPRYARYDVNTWVKEAKKLAK